MVAFHNEQLSLVSIAKYGFLLSQIAVFEVMLFIGLIVWVG